MGLALDTRIDILIISGLLFLIVMTRLIMARMGYQLKPSIPTPQKPVARFSFVLRVLFLSAGFVAMVRLLPSDATAGIGRLILDACTFIVMVFLFRTINGRLLDAGFGGWHCRWITFVWFLSMAWLAIPTRLWQFGLVPLSVFLIAGGTIRSKTTAVTVG